MNNFAAFQPDGDKYRPANKKAIALCGNRIMVDKDDIMTFRLRGHDCRLTNGQPIGVIEICV